MIDQTLSQALQKEIPILTAQIRSLYAEFDKKFHLNGAKIPITFGMEPDLLGSYTRGSCHEKEHFHFSLLFIGYAVKNPLKKEDRLDVTKYSLIVHCGGCMLNEREMRYRQKCALDQEIPITNYGIAIAYMQGILKRCVEMFPDVRKELDQ